jgi:hypothetical protein
MRAQHAERMKRLGDRLIDADVPEAARTETGGAGGTAPDAFKRDTYRRMFD